MANGSDARSVKVALVQMACGEHPQENLEEALEHTRQAIDAGADIICLPELFQTRYFCQSEDDRNFDLAEPVPGRTTDAFARLVARRSVCIIVSLFEKRATGLYHNTAAVIDGANGYVGKYRKMHIPDDPRYYEKYYFTPGDLGFKNFTAAGANLGVLICWDQWYPEAARLTAMQGADILFYPTAIGWQDEEPELHAQQLEAWQTVQRSHAIANGCFVVAVNRTGFEPEPGGPGGIQFWGNSFIAAPDGSVVCSADEQDEGIFLASLELDRIAYQRHGWPFFRDRRIDAYEGLSRRFLAE